MYFLTAISHRGLRNDFFFLYQLIYFPYSIWTFISLYYLDFYLPFIIGILLPFSIWTSIFIRSFNLFSIFQSFFYLLIFFQTKSDQISSSFNSSFSSSFNLSFNLSFNTCFNFFKLKQSDLVRFGQIWSDSVRFGQIQSDLVRFGLILSD